MSIFDAVDTARAWAEVDLDALASNLTVIRRRVGPNVNTLLVAKADAYGHGAVAVARHALHSGAAAIGVTTCSEALELRHGGIRARIVVLGPVFGEEAAPAIESGIELCVPSLELSQDLERAARSLPHRAKIHVKIDTGMARLGVAPERALSLLEGIAGSDSLELAGVMTHLSSTRGKESPASKLQIERFERVLEAGRRAGLLRGSELWVHAANSAAVLSGLTPLYDAVRVGIAAYGIPPDPSLGSCGLKPVLSVRTRIVHLRDLARGERVGYGGTWQAGRRTRIAVLPVGYDDGVAWRLGNRGTVLIHGKRVPIVGRVSMDYITVDVTDLPQARLRDTATLLGAQGAERIGVDEMAELAETIPYEILCSIGKRVQRTYLGGSTRPRPTSTPRDVAVVP